MVIEGLTLDDAVLGARSCTSTGWLIMSRFAAWELDPGPCPQCGAVRWVLWWAAPARELTDAGATTERSLWCRACMPTLPCLLAVAVNLDGELYVWQHPRATLDHRAVATLGWWLTMLSQLARHRAIERAQPGAWRLEVGNDGRLWMPWNPASDDKRGAPWPLRSSLLRKSARERVCLCCARRILEGEQVQRADLRYGGPRGAERGWSREALARAMVCSACAQAVLLAIAPTMPGRRVVKHLVAIDGGLSDRGAGDPSG